MDITRKDLVDQAVRYDGAEFKQYVSDMKKRGQYDEATEYDINRLEKMVKAYDNKKRNSNV